jgi:hypothetical protein
LIALATCSAFPELEADDRLLLEALDGRAMPAVWDDDGVDWDAFELVVVRDTWDYTERPEAFLAWAASLGERVRNPLAVLRWTLDKRYLGELAAAGLPVVPTSFGELGTAAMPVVVKPAVGAGSRGAARFDEAAAARAHLERLHADGQVAMVQPYLERIDEAGETALLYLGGAFSHAIRKGPLLNADPRTDPSGLFVSEDISPREPSDAERAAGDRVMAWLTGRFGELLYARIDLLPGPGGAPLVLECELAEPSLFFAHGPGSAQRMARAIAGAAAWTA